MKMTADQPAQQVALAHSRGWVPVIARAEKRHKLQNGMLLAVASRETNMQDIVGERGDGEKKTAGGDYGTDVLERLGRSRKQTAAAPAVERSSSAARAARPWQRSSRRRHVQEHRGTDERRRLVRGLRGLRQRPGDAGIDFIVM
jgi:uncharacterized protein YkwD